MIKLLTLIGTFIFSISHSFASDFKFSTGVSINNLFSDLEDARLARRTFCSLNNNGFDLVRFPINFDEIFPKDLDTFKDEDSQLVRLDSLISNAISCNVKILLDFHKYQGLKKSPDQHLERFIKIWLKLAERYKEIPSSQLAFEIFNEPNLALDTEKWNEVLNKTLPSIAEIDADRTFFIGSSEQNIIETLPILELPSIPNPIIYVFHYYTPMEFTHQQADWSESYSDYESRAWPLENDIEKLAFDFKNVNEFAQSNSVEVILGEFGVYGKAEENSRYRWLEQIIKQTEKYNIPWIHWDLSSGFGLYDIEKDKFDKNILDVLQLSH